MDIERDDDTPYGRARERERIERRIRLEDEALALGVGVAELVGLDEEQIEHLVLKARGGRG